MLLDLLLLAVCGGLFSVPLYAIIQEAAAPAQRSRMIAANNIMNALFMVAGAAAAAGLAACGLDAPGRAARGGGGEPAGGRIDFPSRSGGPAWFHSGKRSRPKPSRSPIGVDADIRRAALADLLGSNA